MAPFPHLLDIETVGPAFFDIGELFAPAAPFAHDPVCVDRARAVQKLPRNYVRVVNDDVAVGASFDYEEPSGDGFSSVDRKAQHETRWRSPRIVSLSVLSFGDSRSLELAAKPFEFSRPGRSINMKAIVSAGNHPPRVAQAAIAIFHSCFCREQGASRGDDNAIPSLEQAERGGQHTDMGRIRQITVFLRVGIRDLSRVEQAVKTRLSKPRTPRWIPAIGDGRPTLSKLLGHHDGMETRLPFPQVFDVRTTITPMSYSMELNRRSCTSITIRLSILFKHKSPGSFPSSTHLSKSSDFV
jgi:hypothetical protein